jgi:peptide/nickel transport system substrate-binding protein
MSNFKLRSVVCAGLLALSALAASAQVLEVGIDQSPVGLDPHLVTAFSSFMVVNGTIYEGLTAIDKDLRVVPSLAESWTISPDGKTYTFRIRRGVTFHNGTPMDANDAAASLKRVLAKEISSPLASRLAALDSVSAPNATNLVLSLKEPSAPMLTSLATLAIVPRRFELDKDSLQKQPVGTGPFKFREWQPNNFIALDKHATYWRGGSPKLDGVKFSIVPESATRQVGVTSGQYAMLPNIDAATAMQLKGRANVQLKETLELAYTLIGMNVSRPPFNDARVRQALNLALNRAEIVQAALFGAGVPGGPLSPALKDWAVDVKDFPCYTHNPARAMELLKAAGHNAPVAVSLMVLPRQDVKDMAQVVQQQLNKAGFKVELKNLEIGQFIQDWRNSNFDLFASTNAGSPDPDDYFFRTFRTGGSTNVFKYSNPELDGMLDRARAGTDEAVRKRNYAQVQRMLACEGPIAHVAYGQLFTAHRPNVQGFEIIANRSLSSLGGVSLAK